MILVKLGGSVITDKGRYRTFDPDTTGRLALEIARSGEDVVLVHGAGSFGHMLAKEHRLHLGVTEGSQLLGASMVMSDVRELDLEICRRMSANGLRAVPLPPASCASMRDGQLHRLDLDVFRSYLKLGMVPVTFGDVVRDEVRGLSICSGDQLMAALAREFRPSKVIFVTDVDGVFTADPTQDPQAKLIGTVDQKVLDSLPRTERNVDVTGSIFAKIRYMIDMASLTGECLVLNGKVPGRLEAAIRGEDVIASKVVS
ncbi:MAG: Isopentenyl phosphate kinase [Methanomassiliicoccales archaeon PtaB.Bin215]|nr:MAG: Isopentenyl phosphate kinase [Methanomassiliicoccales archaeon PtaB.Bin215]